MKLKTLYIPALLALYILPFKTMACENQWFPGGLNNTVGMINTSENHPIAYTLLSKADMNGEEVPMISFAVLHLCIFSYRKHGHIEVDGERMPVYESCTSGSHYRIMTPENRSDDYEIIGSLNEYSTS